ncbi:MAG TPA: hypothetical protein VGX25_02860 [Actinophytocola sp.]|uniref:hypothetical protein n=1 Tax=Actinophytocola sp. TaxID=1872138 RepID=UPI002DDD1768|nr:hypothetical protein [Actinophytocola sp.]HEV2778318.1 hypothetical protein [Actinophytocola sp.]
MTGHALAIDAGGTTLAATVVASSGRRVRVAASPLGRSAGLLGAARLAFDNQRAVLPLG